MTRVVFDDVMTPPLRNFPLRPSPPSKKKHVLAIKNFVPLAKFIVDHHKDKTQAAGLIEYESVLRPV